MNRRVFENLRMTLESGGGKYLLDLGIASGHTDFSVSIKLTESDYLVIDTDSERAAFLQAALHRPFELKETRLNEEEQRYYLDTILHQPKEITEAFLTEKDHGPANGAIANLVRHTLGRDYKSMREGKWFST